jgi:predicted transcriptional regulator
MAAPSDKPGTAELAYVSARLSKRERARLTELAAATDRTPSAMVRRALRVYINHFEQAEALLAAEASEPEFGAAN